MAESLFKESRTKDEPNSKTFLKILFIYLLFMRDTEREREAETQAEGEAGSMQEALFGTGSWDSRITL